MTSIKRYCLKCKADRDVDGISFRCLTCATLTKYTGQPTAPTASVTEQTAVSVVSLPASVGSRRWMEQTKALADGFRAAAKAAEAKAQAATAEAERLRRAASAFDSLLKQVALEESQVATKSALNGRWSHAYDACRDCGRTDRKHVSRGYCVTCQAKPQNRKPAA